MTEFRLHLFIVASFSMNMSSVPLRAASRARGWPRGRGLAGSSCPPARPTHTRTCGTPSPPTEDQSGFPKTLMMVPNLSFRKKNTPFSRVQGKKVPGPLVLDMAPGVLPGPWTDTHIHLIC